ncbi:MAG: response regulator transcription factor [Micavibrio sp.]
MSVNSPVILIADPHILYREALCRYIRHAEKEITVAGVGESGDLRRTLEESRPDLLLIRAEGAFGESVLPDWFHAIGESGAAPKIGALVADLNDGPLAVSSCHGVFPRYLSAKQILAGIHDILAGRPFYPPLRQGAENPSVAALSRIAAEPYDFDLTVREGEVLTHLLKGRSNKEIARALDLQVVTIKLHVRGICRKMKAANRTQAALIAKENGWN